MNKIKTGLIAGGALGLVGLGVAMANRDTRSKIISGKNDMLNKAEDWYDDMKNM